jgi:predicted transcriptional regulator
MMHDGDNAPTIPWLTTEIVAAYVGHHSIATADFGRLIAAVGQELAGLGREPEQPTKAEPAVPVRRSVQRDHLVCLVCGQPFKSLRRHLRTSHDLTPDAYRLMFELGRDYPMVAAASSEQRAAIAKRSGLGQRRPPEPAPVVQAEPARQPAPKPIRGRRAVKKADPVPA